ncbi:hypothetical protein OBBRIDRAFT_74206 [Obba rivulosa]|uniref:Conserved oligomeric Golgi complex subunit 1 n=1 Tax=Obba rivulosa TaxID=1052685 RepID=A0A8E2DS37_9APHY|nr:hypothetical protein OBBRIDRAFT_74206 [Obba rivulosa]
MARRPSVISNGSLPSSSSLKAARSTSISEALTITSPNHANGHARPTLSSSKLDQILSGNGAPSNLDPDELLSKYTISEIKAVQQRLKSDADAKQEELRLMVGERYRDLLQASTSIISMSQSSQRVLEAFEDVREAISSATVTPVSKRPSVDEDQRLRALQSLSGHLKLLLDAPEHLWRLLESKRYLHAAWLFLLARVVHRALLTENEDGEQQWQLYGMDVSEQFPLVQRQWDTVSQFRSQITHKATLSLREQDLSTNETCATLFTLHLLESRPLVETLTVYLAQRKRALTAVLSRIAEEQQTNGDSQQGGPAAKASHRSRRLMVRATRQKLQAILDIVARTLGIARRVFSEASGKPMMKQVLEFIQLGPDSVTPPPTDLRLTTQVLLSSLPSSSHFLSLPQSITSYKPYVDSASTSASVLESQLSQRLSTWYQQALEDVKSALEKWLLRLETIREIWDVRTAAWTWLGSSEQLNDDEKADAKSVIDDVCQHRLIAVWKSTIQTAEVAFRDQLASCIAAVRDNSERSFSDTQTAEYLYQTPPIPSLPQAEVDPSLASASLDQYRYALRRQLSGRTSLLQAVLDAAEGHVRALERELNCLRGDDDRTKEMLAGLMSRHRRDAAAFYDSIASILSSAVKDTKVLTDLSIRPLVFIARIAEELSVPSTSITSASGDDGAVVDFKERMKTLHQQVLDRWQDHTASRVVKHSWQDTVSGHTQEYTKFATTPRPSSALMHALFTMCASIQQLGISSQIERQRRIAEGCFRCFLTRALQELRARSGDVQTYWDLLFLRQLVRIWGDDATDINPPSLDKDIEHSREHLDARKIDSSALDCEGSIADYLSRTQVLLAPLLPPSVYSLAASVPPGKVEKLPALLHHGQPVVEQNFLPVMDLMKPPQRFGMLRIYHRFSDPDRWSKHHHLIR